MTFALARIITMGKIIDTAIKFHVSWSANHIFPMMKMGIL